MGFFLFFVFQFFSLLFSYSLTCLDCVLCSPAMSLCVFCHSQPVAISCNKKKAHNNAHLMSVFLYVTGIYSTYIILYMYNIHAIRSTKLLSSKVERHVIEIFLGIFFLLEISYIRHEKKIEIGFHRESNILKKFHQKTMNRNMPEEL